jgi:hypothetical protein
MKKQGSQLVFKFTTVGKIGNGFLRSIIHNPSGPLLESECSGREKKQILRCSTPATAKAAVAGDPARSG